MKIRLVVPADVEEPTGGNVYDRALAQALRQSGQVVDVVPCEPRDLAEILGRPAPGLALVDGLLACPAPDAVAPTRPGVLVHMPLGWDVELPQHRARELDELERQALHAASLVVSTSHWSASYLRRRHGLVHVAVAAPGVDVAPVEAGSEPPLLVQVAALLPHKDQLSVVEALSRLRRLPWRARLAGSVDRHPAYAAAVRDAVAASGLGDRIEIAGVMPRDQAWSGADLGLLPSRVEAFGMVVTEALARGIPGVVSDGGAAEALGLTPDGRRPGLVVPPGDVDALTAVLEHWLSDSAFRLELRQRAVARRTSLTGWETTAHQVLRALTQT